MYETGHSFTYLLFKESVAIDVINVTLFACCEPRHRRVKADILNITYDCYSQNNDVRMTAL